MSICRRITAVFMLGIVLFSLKAQAQETRGIVIEARDPKSGQEKELPLYKSMQAVIIGIDKYPNLPYDKQLSYAVRDAKGVENTLKKHFRFDRVITLYNNEATKDSILEVLLGRMSKLDPEDALFVFFAGHGVTEQTRDYGDLGYLVPFDGYLKKDKYYKNISMGQIRDDICKRIPAKHIFFVIDACYSGLLVTRGGKERKTLRNYDYLQELAREPVRQVLTAGSKDQEVLDGGPKGYSVFTGRLIEALERVDGFITASELSQWVKERVYADAKARNHVQTPKDGELFGLGDFIFVKKVNGVKQMQMGQKMPMYQSARVDGCTDYHCLRCTDRDRCSEHGKCSHPNCGHKHGAVLCHGGVLFYLRTRAGYSNCHERAKAVANKLNSIMQMTTHENSKFELEWAGDTPTIWHMMADGSLREKIVTITAGDVEGYRYRTKTSDMSLEGWKFSRRVGDKTVGKIVVAEWWLALLTDHFKLMAQSEKPTETITTRYGSVLYKMWKLAREKQPSGFFPMSIWDEIVNELSQEEKDKLYLAARIIPKDFAESILSCIYPYIDYPPQAGGR